VARIEPNCIAVVGDGAIEVALGPPGVATVVVGSDVLRIDPNRLVVVGDGAVEVTLVLIFNAAVY